MYVDIDNRGLLTINDIHPKDAQHLLEIIQQADAQLLSSPIEVLRQENSFICNSKNLFSPYQIKNHSYEFY